ncbi:MAG: hypothetical protein IPK03_02160 [Bacteroidetes bacterium]|nr:hypothetical protein [Bacteroidota bacterium]
MGLIREPKGIDFIIKSTPLTKQEEKELVEFIELRKLKNKRVKARSTKKKIAIK